MSCSRGCEIIFNIFLHLKRMKCTRGAVEERVTRNERHAFYLSTFYLINIYWNLFYFLLSSVTGSLSFLFPTANIDLTGALS
jgi:hypothetical protein